MEKLVEICNFYRRTNFIEAWVKAGASQNLAEHLFEKFFGYDRGLDITGFYAHLDNENKKRFIGFVKLYKK